MADNGDFRADINALMASIRRLAGMIEHQHGQIAMLLEAALAQQQEARELRLSIESHERRLVRLEGGEVG